MLQGMESSAQLGMPPRPRGFGRSKTLVAASLKSPLRRDLVTGKLGLPTYGSARPSIDMERGDAQDNKRIIDGDERWDSAHGSPPKDNPFATFALDKKDDGLTGSDHKSKGRGLFAATNGAMGNGPSSGAFGQALHNGSVPGKSGKPAAAKPIPTACGWVLKVLLALVVLVAAAACGAVLGHLLWPQHHRLYSAAPSQLPAPVRAANPPPQPPPPPEPPMETISDEQAQQATGQGGVGLGLGVGANIEPDSSPVARSPPRLRGSSQQFTDANQAPPSADAGPIGGGLGLSEP